MWQWKPRLVAGILASVLVAAPRIQSESFRAGANRSLDTKLAKRISVFDTQGRTFLDNLLRLVWTYQLPAGIEYIDQDAVTRPLRLRLSNVSVRKALVSLVEQLPEYRVDFSHGVVDVYSPLARRDPSNLLNTIISRFSVTDLDAGVASAALLDAVLAQRRPGMSVAHSVAGVGGEKLSLSVMNMPAYAILNKIIASQGSSIWIVNVPPQKLSKPEDTPWHVYPLDSAYEPIVLGALGEIFRR